MINIQLTPYQAMLLENIIAFRVLAGVPQVNDYPEVTKEEMHIVRMQIHKEMGWL